MSSRPRIPERLGRYEIVQRLSAGGMGEVFLGRFVGPGGFMKPVAIKRVHPHLVDDPSFIAMLHDEANVAAAVQHPNIVATIDVGNEGDNHFVVLDYVSGDPLIRIRKELKSRGTYMPRWVAAFVGAQIAAALHAVHEARTLSGEPLEIVHRDVSSSNIMMSDAGHPMLFDFGIAKAKQRQAENTMTGEIKGKLTYMAPETFRGVKPTKSVDIFGLGVVLYEILTNISPFQRDSDLETLMALQNDDVPPPCDVRGGNFADQELDRIVMRAMARDREDRYPTAEALERALRDWANKSGVPHDASATSDWLASQFQERRDARKAVLARLANPSPMAPITEDVSRSSTDSRENARGATPSPLTHTVVERRRRQRGWAMAITGLAMGTLAAVVVTRKHAASAHPSDATPSPTIEAAVAPSQQPSAAPQPPVVLTAAPRDVDFSALPDVKPTPATTPSPSSHTKTEAKRGKQDRPEPPPTSEPSKKGPLVRTYDP